MTDDILTEELILDNCSKYIKTARKVYEQTGMESMFLRGAVNSNYEKIINFKPRTKSMNTPQFIHDVANNWFNDKFGVYARTDTIFCTTDYMMADNYGYPAYILPVGNFTYIHSSTVEDMYHHISYRNIGQKIKEDSNISLDSKKKLLDALNDRTNDIIEFMIANYKMILKRYVIEILEESKYEKNKVSAFTSGHEIMMSCEKYIMVPYTPRYHSFF